MFCLFFLQTSKNFSQNPRFVIKITDQSNIKARLINFYWIFFLNFIFSRLLYK